MTDKAPLNLRQKLNKVYARIDHIEKAGRNKNQGYTFLRAVDVSREIRNAFLEYGIYAEPRFEYLGSHEIATRGGGTMFSTLVKTIITLHDADSDETKTIEGLGDGADGGDKGIYKAQTGAVKNALRNGFLIPDEADPEADDRVDTETQYDDPEPEPAPRPRRQVSQEPAQDRGSRPAPVEPTSGPERAAIPEGVSETQAEPTRKRTKVCVPDITMPAGGDLPTEEQLNKCRTKIVTLANVLSTAGLKQTVNMPINRKVLLYVLKTTGAEEATKITLPQWKAFFDFTDKLQNLEGGAAQLAKLVANAAKS